MRQLTIERSAFIIIFALLFAMATRIPADTDTWWHLRSGQHTLTQGMIYADPFSYSVEGQPWINHSWGAQIMLYAAWQVAGNFGLAMFTSLLATGGMYFVYRMSAGNVYLRAFALVVGAATAAVFWSARPHMLSFFFSALLLYLLYLYKREKTDRLWFIPPLILIWGNMHAGFSIAFILMGGIIVGEAIANIVNREAEHLITWARLRKLVIVALISVAALVVNPYGLQMLTVPFQTVGIGALQDFIQEWNSPDFHQRQVWPFVGLLLGTLGAVGASSKRLDWSDFLLFSGTAFMGLLAGRNIALFAVVATPVLTYHLDALLSDRGWVLKPVRRPSSRMALINAVLVGLLVFAALAKVLLVLDPETLREEQSAVLPVAATEFLQDSDLSGPIFNSYNWGGYLIWFLPDDLVFVDGRTDLYGDAFLRQYLSTARGEDGWQDSFDEYGIQLVMVEAQSGLARQLADAPGWSLAYEDEMAVIYTMDAGDNGAS